MPMSLKGVCGGGQEVEEEEEAGRDVFEDINISGNEAAHVLRSARGLLLSLRMRQVETS